MSKVNYPLLMRIACVECCNPHNNHCSQETKESSNSNEHFASMTSPDFSTSLISNFISFSLLRISPRIQALLDCWALYKLEDCKRLHVGKWILLPIIILLLMHYHQLLPITSLHIRTSAMTLGTQRSMHKRAAFHPPKHLK